MASTKTQANYGYCESFFVESYDDTDGIFARAAAERERSRAMSKVQQRHMAADLSRLTSEEYLNDVLDHMEVMEAETMPDINSIEIQTEIQWFMRPYLLDFLLEAHHAFQLLPETLFLAVNLLDRYCSKRVVYKRHYQLVGCASLLIAAKYGDRKERVPTIKELKSMCCSLYDDDMFTQMEWHVLQTLNWIVGHPTVTGFLEIALNETSADTEVQNMATYISEMALYHKDFIPVLPSVMARSSLALSRYVLGRAQVNQPEWAARYDANVVMDLSNQLARPSQALFRKYSSSHLSNVATTLEQFLQRQSMMQAQQTVSQQPYPSPAQSTLDVQQVSGAMMTPQTPQKHVYAAVPIGVLTPPETPEKDFYDNPTYNVNQNLMHRLHACTTVNSAQNVQSYPYSSYPTSYPSQ
ncbi:hypothetical protein M438DRAFT_268849 [Aureobasidium pullulans EXF-150]|uniref:Uncharacterized protein n=1 Tax=Aureobasidium pullulans EXF-150 TaxID=1043002 RepID=A0A074XY77_AURPU|nr:uncharacterized protein M438DRAFT_268849 [Aureobasidium pullulans EXF-150]KEQ86917.1 hypothetical protein M438DRAFT_268849 [Aureobasidium pullulans EXF-150]